MHFQPPLYIHRASPECTGEHRVCDAPPMELSTDAVGLKIQFWVALLHAALRFRM